MKSKGVFSLRILLVITICCSALTVARASQLYSEYDFWDYVYQGAGGGSINYSYGTPDLLGGNVIFVGNMTNFQSTTWCEPNPDCSNWTFMETDYSADLNSGSVWFGASSYDFQGSITGGYLYGYMWNYSFGASGEYEHDEFNFAGTWNTGWTADGFFFFDSSVHDIGQGVFLVYTTTTPEPSSIALFGSGILGLVGVLRRKLKG